MGGGGRKPKVLSGLNCSRTGGQEALGDATQASTPGRPRQPLSPGMNPTLAKPGSTHATRMTFLRHLAVYMPLPHQPSRLPDKVITPERSIQGLLTCLTPVPGDTCHSPHQLHRASSFPAPAASHLWAPAHTVCSLWHALSTWLTPTDHRGWVAGAG